MCAKLASAIFSILSSLVVLSFSSSSLAVENMTLRSGESILMGNYRIACEGTAQTQKAYRCVIKGFTGNISDSGWQWDLEDAKAIATKRCNNWYANLPKSSQQGQIVFCATPSCTEK